MCVYTGSVMPPPMGEREGDEIAEKERRSKEACVFAYIYLRAHAGAKKRRLSMRLQGIYTPMYVCLFGDAVSVVEFAQWRWNGRASGRAIYSNIQPHLLTVNKGCWTKWKSHFRGHKAFVDDGFIYFPETRAGGTFGFIFLRGSFVECGFYIRIWI